jgi:homoserine dehydrogenase
MAPLRVHIVLAGFGNVGRRFAKLLDELAGTLAARYELVPRVVAVATGRHGCAVDLRGFSADAALVAAAAGSVGALHDERLGPHPRDTFETIKQSAPRAGSIPAVLVETTRLDVERGEPAASHIRAAFNAGMHVITANKGPIACAYRELSDEASRRGLEFLFEGVVMDGIPVFNLVRDTLPAVSIRGFRGVVNSTTNYILEAMEAGQPYAEALAEMQRAGVAEADPTLDVDGWDAAAKTAALVNVLLAGSLTPRAVDRTGIRHLTPDRLRAAIGCGRRVKLVASAQSDERRVIARVAPEELAADDPLARLAGMANALVLRTDLLGDIVITQEHGGLTQTAYALVTDLVAIGRRLRARREASSDRSL